MKKYKVGIIGATGMVGQRFITLLENHPWFEITVVAASEKSSYKCYKEAVNGRWVMEGEIPLNVAKMTVLDACKDVKKIAESVDFVFCAVDMQKETLIELEQAYAKAECPVISNNSAHRSFVDVPMIIPEINPDHSEIILSQRKRLNTKRGFVAVKPNCSLQCYVPAIFPLLQFGVTKALVCTYQALSGAGKTLKSWPEMNDNVIPYISGEEEKSELEPMKIFGKFKNNQIINAKIPIITSQCLRVPVSDGHMAAVFLSLDEKISESDVKELWDNFSGVPQKLKLPSAPLKFLHYFEESNRPQISLDRNLENGMAVSIGRLRRDTLFDFKFVCMSHNTIRGAAGGAILMAELLCKQGFID